MSSYVLTPTSVTHFFKWDEVAAWDEDEGEMVVVDSAIPSDLGLTNPLDGSSEEITATEKGVWAITLALLLPADNELGGRCGNYDNHFDGDTSEATWFGQGTTYAFQFVSYKSTVALEDGESFRLYYRINAPPQGASDNVIAIQLRLLRVA